MSASFVESGPTCLLEELVGRTYAALREWSPRHCLSGEAEVFVCVCSRVYRAFLWVVVDFWLNNLRTLFSNCERATLVFFLVFLRCSSAALSRSRGASTVVNTDLDCHLRLPSVPLLEAAVMSLIASPPPPFFPLLGSGVTVKGREGSLCCPGAT